MSETKNNQIPISEIVIPSLDDAGYADGLNAAFDSINANFAQLANRNFVKGENGNSVEIKEIAFFETDEEGNQKLNIFGKKLQECILGLSDDAAEYADVIDDKGNVLNIFDLFNSDPGVLYAIYNTVNDINIETPTIHSSLYYVFLDGRYAKQQIGLYDHSQYNNIRDFSCILVYDKDVVSEHGGTGGFKALVNAFPTIYYEKGAGLCWKVNGTGTGIPVQGIPGKDGLNSRLSIVKTDSIDKSDTIFRGEVSGIYGAYDGYNPVEEYDDLNEYDGTTAVVLVNDEDYSKFYFGSLKLIDDVLYAYCDQTTAINYAIETETIVNMMKSIDILDNGINGSNGAKGIFVPLAPSTDGEQPAHLLSATSITNNVGQTTDIKADVIFTPVNDINSLKVTSDRDNILEGEGNLMVDKYLYVRFNTKTTDLFINDLNSELINKTVLDTYDGVLKYRLETVIKSTDNRYFDAYQNGDYTTGSRCFGRISPETHLDDSNVVYYIIDANGDTTVSKTSGMGANNAHFMSMPKSFKDRITGSHPLGIYRWVLDDTVADFDVESLKNNVEGERYNFSNVSALTAIYTTTVNPGTSTDFIWFNGMMTVVDPINTYGVNDPMNSNGYDPSISKFIIPGWNNGYDEKLFEFVKFVPIYDNDFAVNEDTALNINYNVNITGDASNPKKNITVHGSVNCDDLSVYSMTATGEIKDIYTQDTITGDAGIQLGYDETNECYHMNVASDGKVTTDNGVHSRYVNVVDDTTMDAGVINSDTTFARQTVTEELFVNDTDNSRKMFVGNVGSGTYKFGIEIKEADSIDISRKARRITDSNSSAEVPAMLNELPVVQNNNSEIIVTNQARGSQQLYYNGAPTTVTDGTVRHVAGSGVSNTGYADIAEFDYVKNFNIHRLAVSNESPISSMTDVIGNIGYDSDKIITLCDKYGDTKDEYSMRSFDEESSKPIESNIISKSIQKFEIRRSTDSQKMDRTKAVTISFDKDHIVQLGVKGQCSNGRWPVLWNDSTMKLHVYYTISNDQTNRITEITDLTKSFTIDYTTNDVSNNSKYEWYGYSTIDSSKNDFKYLNENLNNVWRYYAYRFRPGNIVLSPAYESNDHYTIIANAYDRGETVTFYIFPEFIMHAKGQKGVMGKRSVVSGLYVSRPIPVQSANTVSDVLKNINTYKFNWSNTPYADSAHLSYGINSFSGSNAVKATTICNDGLVIRSGNYVFGLGYASKAVDHSKNNGYANGLSGTSQDPTWSATEFIETPVLFCHEYDSRYYTENKEPKSSGTDLEGYARRTDAIPIMDIFNVIRQIRSGQGNLDEYGL